MDKDTGLGLTEFLATPAPESTEATPAPEASETVAEVAEKTEQAEVQPVAQGTEETEKTEEQAEVKPEEKSFSWEADDNPYKKRHLDASKWANQVHMQNLQLQKQLDTINKKLDGTYNPEEEAKANQIQPEVIASTSETVGRIVASREAAYEVHGQEKVNQLLFADNAPFKEIEHLPQVEMRVLRSASPVLEAMKVVQEYAFYKKWGATPDLIEQNIKKAYEKEIEDRVTKKILERVQLKDKQLNGISEARGSMPGSQTPPQQVPPLAELFQGR